MIFFYKHIIVGRDLVVFFWSCSLFVLISGRVFGRGLPWFVFWSWFSGRGLRLVFPMAAVPFAAKALVGTIPEAVMASTSTLPVTPKEMIGDFVQQLPEASSMIENFMQSGASTFVMHCHSSHHVEIVFNSGLTFRGHLVQLAPALNTQWIKLTRVVYGTTENAIKSGCLTMAQH